MYTINTPVQRFVWKNKQIIGHIVCSLNDRDFLNMSQRELYIGLTEKEMDLLNHGTVEELRRAGFYS